MPHRPYHSYNGVFYGVGLVGVLGQLFADWILARETAIRQFFVNNNHRRFADSVLGVESATADQLNLERSEIIRRNRLIFSGWLFSEAGLGLTDVYAAVIPELDFKPGVHVNYQETALHIRDGLPKLKDFPKEFGGSGQMMAE